MRAVLVLMVIGVGLQVAALFGRFVSNGAGVLMLALTVVGVVVAAAWSGDGRRL